MPAPLSLSDVDPPPHGRTAQRLQWQHLAPEIRDLVEDRLGAGVVEARSQGSGYTPGFASVLVTDDGRRTFVKAAGKRAQRQFAAAYATEAALNQRLPSELPAPQLLWVEETPEWVVVAFEHVEGRAPRRPWVPAELDACLDALEQVSAVLADGLPAVELQLATDDLPRLVTGWDQVRAARPDWPHLDEAARLAASFLDVPHQDRFVHFDARDDNFLVLPDGRALLCDWNWPALGPDWLDTVHLLVSAHGDGLDADAVLAQRRLTRDVPPDQIDAAIAGFTGFMLEAMDKPVPPSSPYLRVQGRWHAAAGWSWLCRRRGWS